MPNYWVVRAGDDIQGEVESRSVVGIGWADVGDFGALSLEELKQKVIEAYPHHSAYKRGSIVGQLYRFRVIDVDDIVLTPIKSTRQVLIGRVTGPYLHHSQPERDRLTNTRSVEWIRTDVFRDDMTLPLKNSLGGLMTVFSVKSHAVEIAHLIGATPTDSQESASSTGVSADVDSAADVAPNRRSVF